MSSHRHAEHDYDDTAAPPRICLNCRGPLRGPYCANCGQHDVDYHRSFHHLTHDLLENLFHFEGKFFTSVAWLLAKPGKLTADFNAGRRQSQLNPLRFYIFVTVLFFLGVHLLNHGHIISFDRQKADKFSRDIQADIAKAKGASSGLSAQQGERVAELIGEAAGEKMGRLDQKTITDIIERVRREKIPGAESGTSDAKVVGPTEKSQSPPGNRRKLEVDESDRFGFGSALKRKFEAGELSLSKIADEIEQRVPTLLFLGMPVFALLLKLLYRRSGAYYIEHLIFSVHLHTWAFLVFMVSKGYFDLANLASASLTGWLALALCGWMVWYLFRAFRVVYRQGRAKTWVKIGLLGLGYSFAIFTLTLIMVVGTLAWLVMR